MIRDGFGGSGEVGRLRRRAVGPFREREEEVGEEAGGKALAGAGSLYQRGCRGPDAGHGKRPGGIGGAGSTLWTTGRELSVPIIIWGCHGFDL